MVMTRSDKAEELEGLASSFEKAVVAVCADYRGMTVAQMTKLRSELRKAGSRGRVVKNTLARLSVNKSVKEKKQGEVARFLSTLEGPSFVIFSDADPIAPTKVLAKFAKENEKFRVKGCWLDGAFVDPAGVIELSKMPGRLETLSMLLGLINAPATRLARVINESGAQVARVVDAQRKKLEGVA